MSYVLATMCTCHFHNRHLPLKNNTSHVTAYITVLPKTPEFQKTANGWSWGWTAVLMHGLRHARREVSSDLIMFVHKIILLFMAYIVDECIERLNLQNTKLRGTNLNLI